jgi:hypothetical protein
MTPEELEAIPGVGPNIEKILVAVNAYYAQFEPPAETASSEELADTEASSAEELNTAAEDTAIEEASETEETASVAAGNGADDKREFDTIKNSEGVG